ncbi:MAG TPA: class II aldolase/adducin family protein [Bacteroidales bacterium]|jgi:L-fuculose-phosphate aldolase|nr:class II aldolase/adducin family protein [Bacteroidales bacterium]HOS20944.1 class II aldolase/adducin family protein [Bacteroidales bacterium]HPX45696.1 class II aldolase/adducin family protein [Bacteroidales bacterium]HQC59763.1 class II aldolase/adducin family protein [Bacteroidales bacterium]HQP89802.1 class II aldolase/adducin family protein [Bacteroidales bacterium]
MKQYLKQAKDISKFMRRLYLQKLTTSLGGNISMKIDDRILITPSQIDKNDLKAKDIAYITINGDILKTKHKISIETPMHIAIYNARSDVQVIIHAHPFWCTVAAIWGLQIDTNVTDEAQFNIKKISFANYYPMGTDDLANEIAEKIKYSDVVIMPNHGIVCVGKTLIETIEKLEIAENLAHISWLKQFNDKLTYLPR